METVRQLAIHDVYLPGRKSFKAGREFDCPVAQVEALKRAGACRDPDPPRQEQGHVETTDSGQAGPSLGDGGAAGEGDAETGGPADAGDAGDGAGPGTGQGAPNIL